MPGVKKSATIKPQRATEQFSIDTEVMPQTSNMLNRIIQPKAENIKDQVRIKEETLKKPLMDKELGREKHVKTNPVFPKSKKEQELMMFREIFVKPKEDELERARVNEEVLVSKEF